MSRHPFADFVAFLASVKGDLANITSPPFFLAPESVVEISTCWTERPDLYVAAAREADPGRRALLVLKWIVASHRRQFYINSNVNTGIKKPLNAFLGEVFLGRWSDDVATTETVTEQVSHHPPITACYMSNEKYKIWGDGYSRVEMKFSGNLQVKQIGHAMLHLDEIDEHYLIPFPDVKVQGFFSGKLYPEVNGTYHIVSTSGFVSEITYSGKGFFSGAKNGVEAKVYHRGDVAQAAVYTLKGCWSGRFSIFEGKTGNLLEEWIPEDHPPSPLQESAPVNEQDAWETRRAWREVITALKAGDLSRAVTEKSKIEDAQRAMRRRDRNLGASWEPLFFTASHTVQEDFESLASAVPDWRIHAERTKGVWKFDREKQERVTKPFRGGLKPDQDDSAAENSSREGEFYYIFDFDDQEFKRLAVIQENEVPEWYRRHRRPSAGVTR